MDRGTQVLTCYKSGIPPRCVLCRLDMLLFLGLDRVRLINEVILFENEGGVLVVDIVVILI